MKKLMLFAAAGLMSLAACQEDNGYTINGTVAGAEDGGYVYLQTTGRDVTVLDSAAVKAGKFQFKGNPETAVLPKAITYNSKDGKIGTVVFLDKGIINVSMEKDNYVVAGTANNDAMAKFMDEYRKMNETMKEIYTRFRSDSTLTDAQKEELMAQMDKQDLAQKAYILSEIKANIQKAFGAYLIASFGLSVEVEQLGELLPQIAPEFASDEAIARVKDFVKNTMNTAVGKKYVDFAMKTPEGEDVKLSDFIGKDKYTLIDFWASWCGPCRREMPNVVEAYKQFKAKGFGIVGVSLDQDADKWKQAIKDLNITWPQMSDLKAWQCEGAKLYGVRGIPATVLVDQEGTIVARDLRGEELTKKLAELLK